MKKSVKIITLVLSLALVIGAAIGISASAETTTAPEIAAKNVKVDGNFCLIFAIDPATVAGDDVTVTVYNQDPSALEGDALTAATVQTITAAKTETQPEDINGDGTTEDVIVVETKGVSAKDIADTWWIKTASAGAETVTTYSVKDYAFERLYEDFTILETDVTKKAYRQKQFYLSILEVGSQAQDLLVNWNLEAEGKTPERLANEYAYASIQNGTFSNITSASSYVEIGDTLTLLAGEDFTKPSWKVYTYDTKGALVSTETVALGSTITVAGNTVVVPGWAEGLTPGKYFGDIGDSKLNFDSITAMADTGFSYNVSWNNPDGGSGDAQGHYDFVDVEGRGQVLNIGKDGVTETGKSRLWIPVVDKANGSGNCLVIETDFYTGGNMVYSTSEAAKTKISSANVVWTILSDTTSEGGWNGTSTICNWNNYVIDDSGNVSSENLVGGTYWTFNDKINLEFNTWYNICVEIYDSNNIVVYIDGERVAEWSFTTSTYNTTESNKPSLAQSVRFDWQDRYRPNETYFDNIFVGVISKEYTAAE